MKYNGRVVCMSAELPEGITLLIIHPSALSSITHVFQIKRLDYVTNLSYFWIIVLNSCDFVKVTVGSLH